MWCDLRKPVTWCKTDILSYCYYVIVWIILFPELFTWMSSDTGIKSYWCSKAIQNKEKNIRIMMLIFFILWFHSLRHVMTGFPRSHHRLQWSCDHILFSLFIIVSRSMREIVFTIVWIKEHSIFVCFIYQFIFEREIVKTNDQLKSCQSVCNIQYSMITRDMVKLFAQSDFESIAYFWGVVEGKLFYFFPVGGKVREYEKHPQIRELWLACTCTSCVSTKTGNWGLFFHGITRSGY